MSDGRDEVADWITADLGASISEIGPLGAAGLSREMWAVTGKLEDGSLLDGIVKRDTGRGPLSGSAFTPGREAAALLAVGPTEIAAPRVLAVSADARMFLMERLDGESDVAKAPDLGGLRDDLAANAAALHGLDPGVLGLDETIGLPNVRSATLANLAEFRRAYDALATTEAVVDDAFALATTSVPGGEDRPVLLHGDLGPGNFLFAGGRITGLVDWELWHLGDPMDDLASLWFRGVLRGDPDIDPWFEAYRAASGTELDGEKLSYYRMVTMLRVVVAVLVMQEKDPDRDEAVAGMMLPLLADLVRSAV